ncbi:hypothetical protein AB0I27_17300 [Streptomyces sp. NPDC050597]|uniref:hypothetical protein n=1 Tax=Streptomyces TaxID=1883 RepID=UPI00341630D5
MAALLMVSLAGCGAAGGVRVEGAAPTAIPWSGPAYMVDARSIPRHAPDVVDLTETTTLYGLKWKGWGSSRAEATGLVVDFACVSGCSHGDSPSFPARLVLTGLVKRQYAAYYRRADLAPVRPPAPDWAVDVGTVRLPVPAA